MVLVSFSPDDAKVRQRMLYDSAMPSLKRDAKITKVIKTGEQSLDLEWLRDNLK
jgi:hypothetical protein